MSFVKITLFSAPIFVIDTPWIYLYGILPSYSSYAACLAGNQTLRFIQIVKLLYHFLDINAKKNIAIELTSNLLSL